MIYRYFCLFCTEDKEGNYIYGNGVIDLDYEIHCANDIVKVRIIAVGIKHILVELYGKEVIIKANNLQHIFIVNCKDYYTVGEYLKVRIKKIDIENNIFELNSKDFIKNPFKDIRKYIIEKRRIYW